ncbi:hypothetical protein DL764_009744 [Monosporascus ibericus]|uniref:RING-type domain-containing protein n=1 Tax=Monosporascus ibericus TaxID=155417 RepID=A0A4Q4SU77_9PEZI|nr:hypothetical protein DL764_009744 [Monosporascus ibericus]
MVSKLRVASPAVEAAIGLDEAKKLVARDTTCLHEDTPAPANRVFDVSSAPTDLSSTVYRVRYDRFNYAAARPGQPSRRTKISVYDLRQKSRRPAQKPTPRISMQLTYWNRGTDERPPPAQEPAADTEVVKVIRDENYWPKIRKVIEEGVGADGNRVKLWLDCVICKSPMLRFPTSTFPVRGEHPPELDLVTVLFCGHVFHFRYMREWLRVCKKGSPDNGPWVPSCPGCREPLLYRACGHSINLAMLSPSRPEEIDAKLPCLRDEGGEIPGRCADCQLLEINQAVENLTRLIWEHRGKDARSEQDGRRREKEYTEQLLRTSTLGYIQWAKRLNRW